MTTLLSKIREVWNRLSRLDVAALVLFFVGVLLFSVNRIITLGGPTGFLEFLGVLSAIYLLFRVIGWTRARLLWSLRNRLIVAYLFIAFVPILLLATLAVLAGIILYSQLGAYLFYEDFQRRIELTRNGADHIAAALETTGTGIPVKMAESILATQVHAVHDRDLPGLSVEFSSDVSLLRRVTSGEKKQFSGIVQEGQTVAILALHEVHTAIGPRVVTLRLQVTPEFLATVAPDLGPIQLNLMEKIAGKPTQAVVYSSDGQNYQTAGRITARNRTLSPAGWWLDPAVSGVSRMDLAYLAADGSIEKVRPVLAVFNARPSRLNARIFASLGELRGLYLVAFGAVAIIFLVLEIAALITGIVLTRRITKAIADLYQATQFVQAGDLTHRVRIERRDQLGVLGESFNLMTNSISNLIEEQKHRQRLENELSIAREVQEQLFPQAVPHVPGVAIEAICRAARVVSGDYYDFVQLSPTHVALAIADISGKGISAALLMASLQASLRSQMLNPGSDTLSTAELVSRLNNHLVRNTGDDRFATLFLAVYDSSRRLLRYTNAGHLPALCVANGTTHRLDVGGMVLGVTENYEYEEGSHVVAPGTLLIGYSDGLVEPENVYGEQFGITRLEQAAVRNQGASPVVVAHGLMTAAEEWAGTPEQADDMTVIVARLE